MPKLSVVIITFNEEKNIGRCLESVKDIADEIVVVDSLSTDRTKEICKNFNVQFFEQKFLGYIEQKNFALTKSTHPFVLSLDADEALSEELKQSVLEAKKTNGSYCYTVNRLTNYCGSWIKYGGWYPDKKLRLFDKNAGAWGGVNPHDSFILSENVEVKHLKGDLLHYSYYTKEDHLKQIEHFTNILSKSLFEKGKKPRFLNFVFNPAFKFIRDYMLRSGFLDGKAGFRIARLSAYATYLKYLKLKRLYKQHQHESI